MSKLTLPILCAYIPFNIRAHIMDWESDYVGKEFDRIVGINQWHKDGITWRCETEGGAKPALDRIKLLLRPLSSLTKPIHHNRETFVPLVKLASIQFPEVEFTIEDNRCFGRLNVGVVLEFVIDDEIPFYKEYHNNIFGQSKSDDYDDMTMANITPSEVREKLKEWHMDLWNLLESGDALPIEEDGSNKTQIK